MKNHQSRPATSRRSSSRRGSFLLGPSAMGSFSDQQQHNSSGGEEEPIIRNVNSFLDNTLPGEYFKQDVLRLIHQLKIPKWKSVDSASMANDIVISRISGALTNAVYCVEPPPYLKDLIKAAHTANIIGGVDQVTGAQVTSKKSYHYKIPPKLLLRVYGPQASNLIDRDAELAVLSRLSLRKIGPKLLGTFTNGRFEQFLNATALTKEDLRDPDVSAQIAKRMRELHDNIPLLLEERLKGPSVWKNIRSWAEPAKKQLETLVATKDSDAIKRILGVDKIEEFFEAVEKYKKWVYEKEKLSDESVKRELVFAHNDAQYGNLLRVLPPPGSPLLYPQNEHRQIVVIDFEYSGANPRGYDIANHFCEWMSDYHQEDRPWEIHEERYPTKKEQMNLIESYVEHGMAEFDDIAMAKESEMLFEQVRRWRPAVSAHWCIWGIVQAVIDTENQKLLDLEKADTLNEQYKVVKTSSGNSGTSSSDEDESVEDESDTFDYFAYSSEKAQLFWTDLIQFGIISEQEYNGKMKKIKY